MESGVGLDFSPYVFIFSELSELMLPFSWRLDSADSVVILRLTVLPRLLSQALLFFQVSSAFCLKRTNTKQS